MLWLSSTRPSYFSFFWVMDDVTRHILPVSGVEPRTKPIQESCPWFLVDLNTDTLMEQPSGAVLASVPCPRTLQDVECGGKAWGSNHRPSGLWTTAAAAAARTFDPFFDRPFSLSLSPSILQGSWRKTETASTPTSSSSSTRPRTSSSSRSSRLTWPWWDFRHVGLIFSPPFWLLLWLLRCFTLQAITVVIFASL